MPGGDDGAARLADILASIASLDAVDREALYRQLLAARDDVGPFRAGSIRQPGGAAPRTTVLANPATTLADPVAAPAKRTSPSAAPTAVDDARNRAGASDPGGPPHEYWFLPSGVKLRSSRVAQLTLHDLDGRLPNIVPTLGPALSAHLQQLDKWANLSTNHLAVAGLSFALAKHSGEPSPREKASSPPLQFPFYVVDEQNWLQLSENLRRVHRIMDEHGIPEYVPGIPKKIRSFVAEQWQARLLGVAVPIGKLSPRQTRVPRCAFLRGREINAHARGDATYWGNAILHEFGHACNLFVNAHVKDDTAMAIRLPDSTMKSGLLPYNRRHAQQIVGTLRYLATIAVLVALTSCGGAPPRATCAPDEYAGRACGGCEVPSRTATSDADQRRVARAVVVALLAREDATGFLTDDDPRNVRVRRFYRTALGPLSEVRTTSLRYAAALTAIDDAAIAGGVASAYFIDIEVLGINADDHVHLRVTVTDHGRAEPGSPYLDYVTRAEYCATLIDGRLEFFTIVPPVQLADRLRSGRTRAAG